MIDHPRPAVRALAAFVLTFFLFLGVEAALAPLLGPGETGWAEALVVALLFAAVARFAPWPRPDARRGGDARAASASGAAPVEPGAPA